jgi:hypothetical protein
MIHTRYLACTALIAATLTLGLEARAQTTVPPKPARAAANPKARAPQLEAKAMDLLRAMSASLTGAKSLAFTAVTTYESPSSLGPSLAYATSSEVLLQRPDRLRVVARRDGPPAELAECADTQIGLKYAADLNKGATTAAEAWMNGS